MNTLLVSVFCFHFYSNHNPLTVSNDITKWDSALNKAEYSIGYEDRFLGIMEVAFEDFDTEAIPFHRVWLFKHRGDIIWDRENRVDKLF
jgi:uncharacterized protein (UPF0248 family)